MMYAVVRKDLEMPVGKLSAQAGHAYTEALFKCLDEDPTTAFRYKNGDNGGSKVTLYAKHLPQLERIASECKLLDIPHAVFTDFGHVLLPHFNGEPIVTALGIGPVRRDVARGILRKLQCV
jgi:peptidyl-tRNA hydrolase